MDTRTHTSARRLPAWLVLLFIAAAGVATLAGGGIQRAGAIATCVYSLNQTSYSATEGSIINITVNRSSSSCATQNAHLEITGTGLHPAIAGTNYTGLTSLDLAFGGSGSATSNTYQFQTLDDNGNVAGSTTAQVTLSLGISQGDTLGGTNPAQITILDNDGTTFSFAQSYVVNENVGSVLVTVNRNGPTTGSASVQYQTVNGTALAPGDYTSEGPTTLTFGNGVSTRTFGVPIVNDNANESQESFTLHLLNPSTGTAGPDATVTINDDDGVGVVQFDSATFSTVEQIGTAFLTVSRTGGSSGAATVLCSTVSGGSATAGLDYTTVTNQLISWSAGDSADKSCVIPILQDLLIEGPETVNVSLSGNTGAALGAQSSAVLTINDDDGTGIVSFQSATYTAVESSLSAVISLVRTGSSTGTVSVDCTTVVGGTATANVDYTAGSFTATFGNGVTTATCTIPLINDLAIEGPETVALALTNVTGGAIIGGQSTAMLTIADDETALPVVLGLSPSFGPTAGGTSVTITGLNFTGATSVKFGGLSAPFLVIDANTIHATAPAQVASAVDVTITTPTGPSATGLADLYTYTDGPTVTSVFPSTGPASGVPATFVTITGTNFIPGTGTGTTVTFGGTATANFTVVTTTTITVVAPAHAAGTVDVVVTTPGGSSPISAADEFTFLGSSAPVVTAVTPSSGPVGTVVTISGSGFTGVSCPGGITFGGVAADAAGCVVQTDNSIVAKVPANAPAGTIAVIVTGPGGSSTHTSADNFTNTTSANTAVYSLTFRFTLIGWTGIDNISVSAALKGLETPDNPATNDISSVVTAIWMYDTSAQAYKGYFPGAEGIPGANDFSTLRKGVGYFIAISVSSIQWTVIEG